MANLVPYDIKITGSSEIKVTRARYTGNFTFVGCNVGSNIKGKILPTLP
jgi:hypothetical protein